MSVACQQPLDRIELIHDGRVAETYCHQGSWSTGPDARYKLLVEMGWGPKEDYGDWSDRRLDWRGSIAVDDGTVESVQPRFSGRGQRYETTDDGACRFAVTTERGGDTATQGLVLTVVADADSTVRVDLEERESVAVPFGLLRERTHLTAFTDESANRIEDEFDLGRDGLGNPDPIYHNAAKLKLRRAYPRRACEATVSFADLERAGEDYYYVRASQVDGQYAWGSPVWVE